MLRQICQSLGKWLVPQYASGLDRPADFGRTDANFSWLVPEMTTGVAHQTYAAFVSELHSCREQRGTRPPALGSKRVWKSARIKFDDDVAGPRSRTAERDTTLVDVQDPREQLPPRGVRHSRHRARALS
jgi:hypothetical protein